MVVYFFPNVIVDCHTELHTLVYNMSEFQTSCRENGSGVPPGFPGILSLITVLFIDLNIKIGEASNDGVQPFLPSHFFVLGTLVSFLTQNCTTWHLRWLLKIMRQMNPKKMTRYSLTSTKWAKDVYTNLHTSGYRLNEHSFLSDVALAHRSFLIKGFNKFCTLL